MLCRSGMSLLAGRPGSLFERSIGWMHRLRFVFAFVEWVPRSKSLLKKNKNAIAKIIVRPFPHYFPGLNLRNAVP